MLSLVEKQSKQDSLTLQEKLTSLYFNPKFQSTQYQHAY